MRLYRDEWSGWVADQMHRLILSIDDDDEPSSEIALKVLQQAKDRMGHPVHEIAGVDNLEDLLVEVANCPHACVHCRVAIADAGSQLGLEV